jgi:hypothetical protein
MSVEEEILDEVAGYEDYDMRDVMDREEVADFLGMDVISDCISKLRTKMVRGAKGSKGGVEKDQEINNREEEGLEKKRMEGKKERKKEKARGR